MAAIPVAAGPATNDSPGRARIVMVENAQATSAFQPQPDIVHAMVERGILRLTRQPNADRAWQQFFTKKDVIGIKVYSRPGANSGTRPAVVAAVVEGLLKAGLRPSQIVIWDKRLVDLRLAGYDDLARRYQVGLAGAADSGYDEKVFYDNSIMGTLVAGDLDFDRDGSTTGRHSYVTKLLTTRVTKIINVSPLLNHNYAGVCGNLYSLAMGSIDNTLRFEGSTERLATAVPEIYAMRSLSDRVALNITDALIGQYQGEETSLLHYSTELNELWFSKDPVALDVLGVRELDRERKALHIDPANDNLGLYHNASYFLELGAEEPSKMQIEVAR